jgi:cellobiose PTS system EIIC component
MDKYMDKVLVFADRISNNRYLKVISNGLMATLPINICKCDTNRFSDS